MAERKVTISIDIVQAGNGSARVKGALKDVDDEVRRINRETQAQSKRTDDVIRESRKKLGSNLINEEKRVARERIQEQKKAADAFLSHLKKVDAEATKITSNRGSRGGLFAGSFLGSFAGNVAVSAWSSVTSAVSDAASAVFDFSSRMEQTKIGFATLMKNSQDATAHIRELQKLTTDFPLDFEAIANMSKRLQGAGIEAKKIVPLIKDIGNVAAATGDLSATRLEGLGTAFSQIASKGRVSAEEMEQLAERGVPAWKILSESIGETMAVTRKMAEEGKITSDQLFRAFQRFSRMNFGDAMQKQANTFNGAMAQIKNVLMITASTAFEPLYKEFSRIAIQANQEIQKQKGDFNKIGGIIGSAMGEGFGIAFGEAVVAAARNAPRFYYEAHVGFLKGTYNAGTRQPEQPEQPEKSIQWANPLPAINPAIQNGVMTQIPGLNYNPAADPSTFAGGGTPAGSPTSRNRSTSTILNAMRNGTMMQESGGNARARNGRTDASGLFQVMPANIGPWTQSALGTRLSQSDFLSSPTAQKAVFDHVMGQYLETAMKLSGGNEDVAIRMAAAAWYGGPKAMHRFDDPTKFRANEPSFREYTSNVLARTKMGGKAFSIADVREEVSASLERQSDAKTKEAKEAIARQVLVLYRDYGLLPSKEMLNIVQDMMVEMARQAGKTQPSEGAFRSYMQALRSTYESTHLPSEISTETGPLAGVSDLNLRKTEQVPNTWFMDQLIADTKERWDKYREEAQRAFEDTKRYWEDLLTSLAHGDFKGIWRRFKDQMLQQFIQPASTYLTQLFGGGMGGMQPAMAGGGFGGGAGNIFGSIFGGGTNNRSMGPGGTPYFNPVSQFAGGGGQGFGGGGGIISQLFGAFGGGRGAAPEPAAAAAGMPWLKTLGGSSPIGGAGGGFGGMLRGMGGGSMMAGIGSGLGQLGMIAGSAVGGKWGNLLSLTGMGASIGASFGPWGAAIGAGIGAGAGLISMLFMRDNSLKKLKEAAASEFGISVKDKDILKQLKAIGEQYFGKGQAGKNAQATVRTEEGMNILRAYAESTGQSGLKIDRLNYGDENWSGNQFRGQFGGFRARGGHVSAGVSYIVGERRPEVFTPSTSGTISPSVSMSDPRLAVVLAQVEEALQTFTEKFEGVSPDKVLMAGAAINPYAVSHAQNEAMSRDPRGAESLQRNQGIY